MVYVCPEKDSVCGDLSSNWCGGCPMWQKRQRLGSATLLPMPGLPQPTPPQAPEADTEHEQRWPNAVTQAPEEVVQRLMTLAMNLAHVYSFVGDESMPIAKRELESALRAALATQAEAVEVLRELVEANAQQDRAKTPMAENVAWDRIEAAWSRATALVGKGE